MMVHHKQYVYKLTFTNGMVYIGSTHSVKERWSNSGIHYKGMAVYKAIEEFGWDNIKKEVVFFEPNSEHKVREAERAFIRENSGKCYNCVGNQEWEKKCRRPSLCVNVWTFDGVTKPAKYWAEKYGKPVTYALARMKRHGMTPKEAFTFPPVPSTMNHHALEYWKSLGLVPGTDKTSFVATVFV